MKTKGLTLVELGISMAILMTIMVVTGSIFSVSIKSYQTESQRSIFQRDLNLATDLIARDIKQSQAIQSYPPNYNLSATTLSLVLPAIDSDNNFIYDLNGNPKTDVIVYFKPAAENNLYKVVFPYAQSKRSQDSAANNPKKILSDYVTSVNFSTSPNSTPRQVDFGITLAKTVSGKLISVSSSDTAISRNK